jgi:hypothetical protein
LARKGVSGQKVLLPFLAHYKCPDKKKNISSLSFTDVSKNEAPQRPHIERNGARGIRSKILGVMGCVNYLDVVRWAAKWMELVYGQGLGSIKKELGMLL